MRTVLALTAVALATTQAPAADRRDDPTPTIIALERGALDRWGRGDPAGFLEIGAAEQTYFDPALDRRLDGAEALREYYRPLAGKIRVDRYDLLDPKVQHGGELAVLSFNLVSYRTPAGGKEQAVARWNSTEVYRRIDGRWRIVHSHWSFVHPELKETPSELAPDPGN